MWVHEDAYVGFSGGVCRCAGHVCGALHVCFPTPSLSEGCRVRQTQFPVLPTLTIITLDGLFRKTGFYRCLGVVARIWNTTCVCTDLAIP